MNRIFTQLKKLKICLVLIFSLLALESYSQSAGCNVLLTSIRDTIACGESIDIEAIGLGGVQTDDFSGSTLSGLWQSVTAGYVIGGPCGTNPNGGVHLWFGNGCAIPRAATTDYVWQLEIVRNNICLTFFKDYNRNDLLLCHKS